MKEIIFDRKAITALAEILFGKITTLPVETRSDDKERTGIQVLAREVGTPNLIITSARQPADAAKFFVCEKAVRASLYGDYASQNTADPEKLQYAGCVGFRIEGGAQIQVSTSGLKAEEDVVVSIILLADILNCKIKTVVKGILESGGKLPKLIAEPSHYLFELLVAHGYEPYQ